MLIECLIEREGVTEITLEKIQYRFMPIPKFTKSGNRILVTTSFCDVNSEEHINYLLARPEFREYKPSETIYPEEKLNPLQGFAIEKFGDAGYMVVDRRKKEIRYIGDDHEWRKQPQGMKPFPTEMAAYMWLKAEAQFESLEHQQGSEPEIPSKKGKETPLAKILA